MKGPRESNIICGLGALYLLFLRKQSVNRCHDPARSVPVGY